MLRHLSLGYALEVSHGLGGGQCQWRAHNVRMAKSTPLPFPHGAFEPFASLLRHGQRVRLAMSTRSGGVSLPPFDSLNVGDHVGDDAAAVSANRRLWSQNVGLSPVCLQQVHGWHVAALSDASVPTQPADAAWTAQAGVACSVMVADCLPVLFAHRRVPLVAAAHAGWRGLAGQDGWGVLEATVSALAQAAGQSLQDCARELCAWLGACIGAAAFEVGPEVRSVFVDACAEDQQWFSPSARARHDYADLAALARSRLKRLGLDDLLGNDGSPAWCTHTQAQHFFSHRRDGSRLGRSGRMVAAIALVAA